MPKRPTKQEQAKFIQGILKHPALKLVSDDTIRHKIIFGDIEWHCDPKLEKIKCDAKASDDIEKLQFAWIIEATEFIAMHLHRWIEEEIEGDILEWDKTVISPFTARLVPLKQPCEDLLDNTLPARLPAFQQRFREKYECLKEVASKADFSRIRNLSSSISDFKSASESFIGIVLAIHSEALNQVRSAGTIPGGGGGGEGQKKQIWFISWSIAFIKSAYHIAVKAMTEAMMDKMGK